MKVNLCPRIEGVNPLVLPVGEEGMADFARTIETKEGLVVFSFTKIFTVKGVIYFVSVTGRGLRERFHMEERTGTWKLVAIPRPSEWLFQYEEELAKVIEDNLP